MIAMIDVCRHFGPDRIVLERANLRVDNTDRVGILAPSGGGKTCVARLLRRLDAPNSGHVSGDARLSWPVGFSAALHPDLSGAENVAMLAGLYNLDPIEFALRAEEFAELGAAMSLPFSALSPGQRSRLTIALSLSVPFDIYLADEFSAIGDRAFQDKCEAALKERLTHSGLILLTRHVRTIARYATRFVVLAGGRFIECTSPSQAQDVLELDQQKEDDIYALL